MGDGCRRWSQLAHNQLQAGLVLLLISASLTKAASKPVLPDGPGAWFGSAFEAHTESVAAYVKRVGFSPAIFNIFVPLPLEQNGTSYLRLVIPQFIEVKSVIMLTVTPTYGLSAVTEAYVSELAFFISQAEQGGCSVMVRYAHEMNGNWYPWAQFPVEYVKSFQMVTNVLRNQTCSASMVWAPNTAYGYPWRSGNAVHGYGAAKGTPDFTAMDTNGNGNTDAQDDPFLPYYPGDEYVDWVGTSIDHFGGVTAPYTKNMLPSAFEFVDRLQGNGAKSGSLANLYKRFSADKVHQKPLVLAETGSMWLPDIDGGASEFDIKSAWWRQALNVQGDSNTSLDVSLHFPMVKAVVWFDEKKVEKNTNDLPVDWQFSVNPQVLDAFTKFLMQPATEGTAAGQQYWKLLDDVTAQGQAAECSKAPPKYEFQSPPPQAPLEAQNPVLPNGMPSGYTTSASGSSATSLLALVNG